MSVHCDRCGRFTRPDGLWPGVSWCERCEAPTGMPTWISNALANRTAVSLPSREDEPTYRDEMIAAGRGGLLR